jgi:hypothetical protein
MAQDNLVSVEAQTEVSATTGERHTRIFLKMYVDAVHSGLIADMGAERWQTLCVIAAFMNEKGECHPTQDLIAHRLKIRRDSAAKRLRNLCDYTWNGRPLVTRHRVRNTDTQKWQKTIYTIQPISQLAIFDGEAEEIKPCGV